MISDEQPYKLPAAAEKQSIIQPLLIWVFVFDLFLDQTLKLYFFFVLLFEVEEICTQTSMAWP